MENHAYIHTCPYACKHIHICAFMAHKEKTPLMYRSPSHPPKDPDSHKLWLNRVPDSLWICLLLQKLLPWDLWPVRKWNTLFIRVAPTHSESRKAETLCIFLGMQSSLKGSEALLLLHREHTCAHEGMGSHPCHAPVDRIYMEGVFLLWLKKSLKFDRNSSFCVCRLPCFQLGSLPLDNWD